MRRLSEDRLVSVALTILEELAASALAAPVERPPWLRIVLAWLFARAVGDPASGSPRPHRGFFDNYWASLASRDEVGRQQGLNASLNGIYRQVGRERQR